MKQNAYFIDISILADEIISTLDDDNFDIHNIVVYTAQCSSEDTATVEWDFLDHSYSYWLALEYVCYNESTGNNTGVSQHIINVEVYTLAIFHKQKATVCLICFLSSWIVSVWIHLSIQYVAVYIIPFDPTKPAGCSLD